jgi:hypothetical protein
MIIARGMLTHILPLFLGSKIALDPWNFFLVTYAC